MADICYVVDKGLEIITNLLSGLGGLVPKYVGWGTGGATAAAATQTALTTPASETSTTAVTGTPTRVTTSTANDTLQIVATITCAGAAKAISEVAIFDSATVSGANMFLRGTFSDINVSIGDSIEFTIKAQFNQA